ncbi:MAG TPA: polyprenyl synthetase family protein [Bacteroidales bacterium]|nr:polyprenyl synthetase family protein [Bacteroidales bacterium]HPE57762.1 polyprenyl synthetase family protein [Bacteroidales bacterium]HRX95325.1 polyprenyl synthetase family protein [Bacteroidales bacterium]
MSRLNEIKKPIASHLDIFETKFRDSMKSNVALLDIITRYIIKRKGKQMRPMFVFLTADIVGEIKESTYTAASLIELLHTATLVHDDVVDDSNERRGFFSINALWKNKVAVLVGDYLLSKGLLLSLDNDEFELLKIVSAATREMSEGELLQIEKARKLDVDEAIYFEIIRKKTASLIASCCASGAASAGASPEVINKMKLFGEKVGIAFQIKDDLFDYESSNKTGKPNGIDIKEQKMTLPLINLLNNSSWSEKRKIVNIVKNHNTNPEKVKEVIDMVNKSGGIAYARQKMENYHNEAIDILSTFPESESKSALKNLVDFTIERKK